MRGTLDCTFGSPGAGRGLRRITQWEAFEKEALPHGAAIEVLALRLTRDPDDAADLVQEKHCKALRHWHTYRLGTNCRAWLWRVCRSEFIRGWHRGRRRPDQPTSNPEEAVGQSVVGSGRWYAPTSDPADHLLYDQLTTEVEAAITRLPPHYRLPLRLRLRGFRYGDIADAIGLPRGTVKSRLHRGRRLLQEVIVPLL